MNQKLIAALSALGLSAAVVAQGPPPPPPPPAPLPPVPAPAENPITVEKALLGKILFWEEQMSSTDTMACGTCHQFAEGGGSDPRPSLVNPGPDGVYNTPDDIFGSNGVRPINASGDHVFDTTFGAGIQVTGRYAPSSITSQWSSEQFWDGRATSQFVDPQTGNISIQAGGSLESQSVGPPLSSVEMAHAGRNWNMITAKLQTAKPMALASSLTPDIVAILALYPDYPSLFTYAFGDAAITSERIAFALATYERTLVPDQSPFDLWIAGNPNALTQAQLRGWGAFNASGCAQCHSGAQTTNNDFHNIGIRPIAEDSGRFAITGQQRDRGRFKTPSLRNIKLRKRYGHNGQFTTLAEVIDFYRGAGAFPVFQDNLDNRLPQTIPGQARNDVIDFMENALLDPRVEQGLPPFDRPTLRSELAGAIPYGAATPGTGNVAPELLIEQPAFPGASDYRIGLAHGAPNSLSVVGLSGNLWPAGPVWIEASSAGFIFSTTDADGMDTWKLPIPALPSLSGISFFVQGFVADPGSTLGASATRAARVTFD